MDKELLDAYDYITQEMAKANGMSKTSFYNYVEKNGLESLGSGIYCRKGCFVDDLFVLHKRCPQGIFSHSEAFYYYGLSDREPKIPTLTTYSGFNSHRLTKDGKCKVFTVKKELLELGKTTIIDFFGNEVPMYDLERTICDLFRSRNKIEINEFNVVLKSYIQRKDKDLNKLMYYAECFSVANIAKTYLRILL